MKWMIFATLSLVFTFGPGLADAHSKKQTTQPADGTVLATSPDAIAMTFEMPLRVTLITLKDQGGTKHSLNRTDNMQPVNDFSATVPALPAGQYTVDWRGLAADGHPMQGAFSFEIAQ